MSSETVEKAKGMGLLNNLIRRLTWKLFDFEERGL